jgi:hypothetical protein
VERGAVAQLRNRAIELQDIASGLGLSEIVFAPTGSLRFASPLEPSRRWREFGGSPMAKVLAFIASGCAHDVVSEASRNTARQLPLSLAMSV